MNEITLTEIGLDQIVYDRETDLFPYSPRREIDRDLVAYLKISIRTMGMWQPIVVRAETLEGIAGNHRYLAYRELFAEGVANEKKETIPAILVACDEGTAVTIALAENEIREGLTPSETVAALLRGSGQKAQTIATVFDVDAETVKQLRLWETELSYENEIVNRQRKLQEHLTRKWIMLINDRLAHHPKLRKKFMAQLRYPSWVQARTLAELDQAILAALRDQGAQFESGKTWHEIPAEKCFNAAITYENLQAALQQGTKHILESDHSVAGACPHLRLFPAYVRQFVPDPAGDTTLTLHPEDAAARYLSDASQAQTVAGYDAEFMTQLSAFCVAPDARHGPSCFASLAAEKAQETVQELVDQGLPAIFSSQLKKIQAGEAAFVWPHPKMGNFACGPETCLHADDDSPGYVLVVQPDGNHQMVCVHAECGPDAQEQLGYLEAEQRQQAEMALNKAITELQVATVSRTLFPQENPVHLGDPDVLAMLERLLVPEWDTPSMWHVVMGWQQQQCSQLARELGFTDGSERRVRATFRKRYNELAQKPNKANIVVLYQILRDQTVESVGPQSWLACLALVRGWRDEIHNLAAVEVALNNVQALSNGADGSTHFSIAEANVMVGD